MSIIASTRTLASILLSAFTTDIGLVSAQVDGDICRLTLPIAATVHPGCRLRVEGRDLSGTYVEIGAHGGVGDGAAGGARAMFKGSKRLSLTGGGGGISAGIAMGGFTIAAQ